MAPLKTAVKGSRKKSGAQKSTELDKENQCNQELEKQIRDEMERAQDQSMPEGDESVMEEEEMTDGEKEVGDGSEEDEGTTKRNSAFRFAVPRPVTAPNSRVSGKAPVTPTKISGELNFLKRSINDLSSTPEPVIRKNPKITKEIENILLSQILSKLEKLSETVESQTAHILSLEKKIDELSIHSKGNIETAKANRVATKKIETMPDRVATMASITLPPPSSPSPVSTPKSTRKPAQNSHASPSTANKTNPHLILDLTQCAIDLNERPLKAIREHLQSSLKASNRTKDIEIRAMSRDNRKDHRYFMFVTSHSEENILRVHSDEWFSKAFPKAHIQATTLFPIRVDNVSVNAVLDTNTGRIMQQAAPSIAEVNGGLAIGRIGCLSQPGKKYGSMVMYQKDKAQADKMLARGFIEVGGESATTQVWAEKGKGEQRCFNCQQQVHLARTCKGNTVCGNCAEVGHHHRDCLAVVPKCTKCRGNHRAKDHKPQLSSIPLGIQFPRLIQARNTALELEHEHSQMNNEW